MSFSSLKIILTNIGLYSIILKMLYDSVFLIMLIVFSGFALFFLNFKFKNFIQTRQLIFISIFLAAFFNAIFVQFSLLHSWSYLFISAASASIGYSVATIPLEKKIKTFNYLLVVYLSIISFAYVTDPSGFRGGSFFDFGSINLTTSLLFFIACSNFFVSRNIHLLSVAILFLSFFSFVGDTRSGLLLSLFLILLGCTFIFININNKFYKYLGSVFLLLIFFNISLYIYDEYIEVISATRFYNFGVTSIRFDMWSEWLYRIDFASFILGLDLNEISTIALYDGNPHNSLIYSHSRYGISAVLLFLAFFYYNCVYLKHDFIGFLVLFFILMRSLFDILMMFLPLDVFIYFMIFSLGQVIHPKKQKGLKYDL